MEWLSYTNRLGTVLGICALLAPQTYSEGAEQLASIMDLETKASHG